MYFYLLVIIWASHQKQILGSLFCPKGGDEGVLYKKSCPQTNPHYCFYSGYKSHSTCNVWKQSLLSHQPSPGRHCYYSYSSGDATSCIKLHWNIFLNLAALLPSWMSSRFIVTQSAVITGFGSRSLLCCENHKSTGACLLPLFTTWLFRFHGYLAPISSSKCKSEAEDGL